MDESHTYFLKKWIKLKILHHNNVKTIMSNSSLEMHTNAVTHKDKQKSIISKSGKWLPKEDTGNRSE